MNWFLIALKKYATFSGRAQRAEYFYYFLFVALIFIGLTIIDNITGSYSAEDRMGLLGAIFSLATFIPSLAVSVRRLHDIGHSGWWLLIGIIPLIGFIVLLIFFTRDSAPSENSYGPNPKAAAT